MNLPKDYSKIFKKIVKKIGNKTTDSEQLDRVGKQILGKSFMGVFPSDMIPKLKRNQGAILNLDNSSEPGSHWVGLYRFKDGKTLFYDSFGRYHTQIIPSLNFSGNGKIINTDDDKEQLETEFDCGARSLAFLIYCKDYGFVKAKSL